MRSFVLSSFILLATISLNAQVGIGTVTPASTLDIIASDILAPANTDGILIPRMDEFPLIEPTIAQDGMMVFISGNGAAIRGFYFWNNGATSWDVIGGASGWLKTGNTDIVNGNFIGTGASTNVDVAFRRNNAAAGNIGATSTNFGLGSSNVNTAAGTTAFGVNALAANVSSIGNTAVGYNALSAGNASNNTAMGYNALLSSTSANNTAVGSGAGQANSKANSTFLGYFAGNANTGDEALVIGYQAGTANTGARVTTVGNWAGRANAGTNNTYIGYNAGALLNQGACSNNTALGYNALQGNTGRVNGQNTAIGTNAMENLSNNANNNTAVGYQAGAQTTSGSNNVMVGYTATVTTGSSSTVVGYGANSNTFSNSIALGFQAAATQSNHIRLGNGAINLATTSQSWTVVSDRRKKSNIIDSPLGLDFVKTLRPVSYFKNNDEKKKTEYGFIAQEVETAFNNVGDRNNGVVHVDPDGNYGLRYNDFIPMTVKAVQEQQTLIEKLQKDNEALKNANADILKRLEAIENK